MHLEQARGDAQQVCLGGREPTQTSRGGSASACDTFGVYAAGSTQDGMTTTWRAVRDARSARYSFPATTTSAAATDRDQVAALLSTRRTPVPVSWNRASSTS